MSAVLEHVNTTVSTTAAGKTTDIARNHENIDRHVVRVAQQVAHLIQPIMSTWSSFPGWADVSRADDLLLHLTDKTAEWDEDRVKPSAADLMTEVQAHLDRAMDVSNTLDGLDGHDARRLLIREALNRAKAACQWCIEAHARVDAEAAQPAAPAAPAAAVEPQSCQAVTVCEGIALQASILLKLVDSASANPDTNDLHDALDAIRIIVASIGSLADGFNDESMRGNQYGWHLGEDIQP